MAELKRVVDTTGAEPAALHAASAVHPILLDMLNTHPVVLVSHTHHTISHTTVHHTHIIVRRPTAARCGDCAELQLAAVRRPQGATEEGPAALWPVLYKSELHPNPQHRQGLTPIPIPAPHQCQGQGHDLRG